MRTLAVSGGGGNGVRKAVVDGTEVTIIGEDRGIKSVKDFVDFVTSDGMPDIDGIACSLTGDLIGTRVKKSCGLSYLDGIDITAIMPGFKVSVINDLDAEALGMIRLTGFQDFIIINIGGGLNGRLVRGGKIQNMGAEWGHTPMDLSEAAQYCGCGLQGCWELILGGNNLERRVRSRCETLGIEIPTNMRPAQFLDTYYARGIQWATEIYGDYMETLARFIAAKQTDLNIDTIVWRGGTARGFLDKMKQERVLRRLVERYVISPDWAHRIGEFCYSWDYHFVKDADEFIGAAVHFHQVNPRKEN